MSEMKRLRKRWFVDPKTQGMLILRVATYWLVAVVAIVLVTVCWGSSTGPARPFLVRLLDMWPSYGPAVLVSFLVLPVVLVDIVRFSNRFVGPTLRLRRAMRQLARGEYVEPIEFRDTDLWQDFADSFNAVLAHTQGASTCRKFEGGNADEDQGLTAIA
ncbi:MAG: hypothetical protein LLG00_09865 [Planctomycetaceae bacterium]|nr:hypothetical protein [Planctomycetaceae bacterium]